VDTPKRFTHENWSFDPLGLGSRAHMLVRLRVACPHNPRNGLTRMKAASAPTCHTRYSCSIFTFVMTLLHYWLEAGSCNRNRRSFLGQVWTALISAGKTQLSQ